MYIPLEWLFSIITIVVAYGTYKLGRSDDEDYRQDRVDATLDHFIKENMVKWIRHPNGEIELFTLDEK